MGTDNIHHAKKSKEFERGGSKKPPGKRYLVVCEGSKTEPNYFKELRHNERLKTTFVHIYGKECGSDPVSVVEHACQIDDEEKGAKFDMVFCVIDKDDHKNLTRALEIVESKGKRYVAILSEPCFEYWLILHYSLHRGSFIKTAKKSIGEVVLSGLKTFDKTYAKGGSGVWLRYKDKLDTALANSRVMSKTAAKTGNKNPSTNMHEVMEALLGLASPCDEAQKDAGAGARGDCH